VSEFPEDVYTEPQEVDVDTLANLGPLAPLAGIWEGVRGIDVNPKPEGPRRQVALAVGKAAANARSFTVAARRGSTQGASARLPSRSMPSLPSDSISASASMRWQLVVRGRHGDTGEGPGPTFSSHRPQYTDADRRAHAESAGAGAGGNGAISSKTS